MSLSVTGFDANGRITPKGTNVVIPPESAGIGDLVYKSGSTIKVIGRGTASASSITIGGSTYTLYGCIYGFTNGFAMIVAPNGAETSAYWATSNSPTLPSGTPEYGGGTVLMRNGKRCTYAQMNTARQMASDSYRGTAGTNVHPTAAYDGGVMTESSFNSNTNSVKNIYGTWKEYLMQTLRVNGAPGTPFGAAVAGDVKVHEFGRWMTRKLYAQSSSVFPAAKACYEYNEGGGTWWLPSMFELAELMIDDHLNKINENSSLLSVSNGVHRWSCGRYSSGNAWFYDYYGISNYYGFADLQFTVRPVTLLKLS